MFRLSPKTTFLPVIHGSADFALAVRRIMLEQEFDCVAVPLPDSFRDDVEAAIQCLPTPTIVVQESSNPYLKPWTPQSDAEDDDDELDRSASYVPVDPCQPVIAALRSAIGEHIAREFIDLETAWFEPYATVLPDAYALKKVALERFAAALLPVIERPEPGQRTDRIAFMAARMRELESRYNRILHVCSVHDWPWLREAYAQQTPDTAERDQVEPTSAYEVEIRTLAFMLGELPFITALYERARAELEDDGNLSVDGVKELLIAARQSYRDELRGRARKITPLLLRQTLKYIRNLALLERRFTPDLYTIVMAAKQVVGDQYALHVAEMAREYPLKSETGFDKLAMGIDQGRLPNGDVIDLVSRLPSEPVVWRSLQLQRRPDRKEVERWKMQWNPFSQCSWPPEDDLIENFRAHVFDRARQVMGADLARTEKFTTSVKDGVDIRDTLRHWYEGDIYVKELPPSRGNLDAAVMLFDSPADPRDYPWRTTWFAEHENESTLAFFATDFREEPVGPGICQASYGGALFLFPPAAIPDIWHDPRLDFTETLEERVLAAACLHSECPHIALLSPLPPGPGWRRLAKHFGKGWVHLPVGQFSQSTLQQLRMVHVLNGREVRSYAAHFIRRP